MLLVSLAVSVIALYYIVTLHCTRIAALTIYFGCYFSLFPSVTMCTYKHIHTYLYSQTHLNLLPAVISSRLTCRTRSASTLPLRSSCNSESFSRSRVVSEFSILCRISCSRWLFSSFNFRMTSRHCSSCSPPVQLKSNRLFRSQHKL